MSDRCKAWRHSTFSSAFRTLALTIVLALLGTGTLLAQFGETTQYFPHFVLGGGWITIFTIHNPSASAITVRLEMYNNDGSIFSSDDVALNAGGTQSVSIPPPAVLTTGWARLTSVDSFSGTMLFKFLDSGGQLISQVGVLPSTTTDRLKIFGTVHNETGSNTGIAVANPSETSNSVLTVQRFNAAGLLQDIRTVILGPQQQLARFLTEDPYFVGLNNFDGIVEVSATQPVTAVTLLLEGSEIAAVGVIIPQSVLEGVLVNTASPFNTGVGSQALGSNTTGTNNTAYGYQSLFSNTTGNDNTATGYRALYLNMTGSFNTATGYRALFNNTTGSFNTATGHFALVNNTTGTLNTATGYSALLRNTTGIQNTASGYQALFNNTAGLRNTASGYQALNGNDTGERNTGSGYQALLSNTTGNSNTAIGDSALRLTTGNSNTAIGNSALGGNTTGGANTAIGNNAGVSSGNLSNATAIGSNAIVDASNKVRIGNDQVTVVEIPAGVTITSDRNRKEGFHSIDSESVLKKLAQMPVTSWNYIGHDPAQFRHYGPMAQDFFAAFGHDGVGTVGTETTISSSDLSGILMLAVQALEKRTTDLQAENAELKARLEGSERTSTGEAALRERIERLEHLFAANE